MERCKYELFVEDYFGFNTDEVINEKTKITTDFGQLVNLLAMFDNERGADDTSHESSGLNKPVVNARAFVESCGDMTEYVDGSKIALRFKKFTVPVIEYNELRKAADDYDSQHVR